MTSPHGQDTGPFFRKPDPPKEPSPSSPQPIQEEQASRLVREFDTMSARAFDTHRSGPGVNREAPSPKEPGQPPTAPQEPRKPDLSKYIKGGSIALGLLIMLGLVQTLNRADERKASIPSPSRASAPAKPVPRPVPPLRLLSFNCYSEHGYDFVEGQVKNISSRPLRSVLAMGTWYTEDKTFVKSDDALVEYDPILPGQVSPFKVMTRRNPAIERCGVSFKHFSGGAIGVER